MIGTQTNRRPYASALVAIAALGGLFRFGLLTQQPLWRDEAFTAVVVRRPLGAMLAAVSQDSAPPLYYVLEHLVAQVDGSPWALRLVSAAAGTALIPLVAALARRIHGDRAGLWAAIFVAVVPTTVIAARDARMYALAATLVIAATLLLWRAIERPSPARWTAYGLAVALAIWTDYFAILAVLATLVAAMWLLRPVRRTIAVAGIVTAGALATLAPWLAVAQAQLAHAGTSFWVEPFGVKTVAGTLAQFLSGPPVDPGIPFGAVLLVLQGVAIGSGSLAMLVVALRRDRLGAVERRAAGFCAAAGIGGILALIALSLWRPLLEARYAGVMWTPLFALAGTGLALVPRRAVAFLVVAGLAIPSLALSLAVTHPRTDLLLPVIDARLSEGDLLVAYPSQYLQLLELGGQRIQDRLLVVGDDVPWFWGTAAYPEGAVLADIPTEVIQDGGRILYVAEPEDPPLDLPPGYRPIEQACEVRVCLSVFAPGS